MHFEITVHESQARVTMTERDEKREETTSFFWKNIHEEVKLLLDAIPEPVIRLCTRRPHFVFAEPPFDEDDMVDA
jgi:hypothetical protein